MIYTPKMQKAIAKAIQAHQGQTRKGKSVPYITHPLIVGFILANAGALEDVVIAGILHDTIEDSDLTKTDIKKEFGDKVARIVNNVTEQDKSLPWVERKQQALEHITEMDNDSLFVKSADVLHNLTDQINDYKEIGDEMFNRFNAPKEAQLERIKKLVSALEAAWPSNPLLSDIRLAYKKADRLWSII